jgi:hypothetical protein
MLTLPDLSQQIADGLEFTQSISFPEGTVFSVSHPFSSIALTFPSGACVQINSPYFWSVLEVYSPF